MTTADKLLFELGYNLVNEEFMIYEKIIEGISIVLAFNKTSKTYGKYYSEITKEEHIAIHEKMKELGWLEC